MPASRPRGQLWESTLLHVHSQPVGVRPTVELEHTDHPLAVEQCEGITVARVQAIAEQLLHPGPSVG